VLRGADGDRLAVFHTRGDRLIAVEAINARADFMAGKQLIRDETALALDRLADPSAPLHSLPAVRTPIDGPDRSATRSAAAPDQPDRHLPGPGSAVGHPRATFIRAGGEVVSASIASGLTLMDGAVRHNVAGIVAECGGRCSCGTCHVLVEPEWEARLPEPEYEETELLEFLEGRQPNSRLSCQIVMSDEIDGIAVRVPALAL